ncbi:NAD-dependent epimerase/dehydratase family protein [Microbacterium sp. ZW T5_56]|uniref:NAD-dependent epimerase/dehydratase family protein n=1 Tax=Microbacterium sp. ZW T5_56 TaxID=3378081 RepID=UPI003851DDCE
MRVMVTGGRGRLGRTVVQVLHERGHAVVSVDRAGAETAPEATTDDEPRFRAVDLQQRDALRALVAEERPEAIVHLAAIAVPFSRPEHEIFAVNTSMAFQLMEAAVDFGVARVLAASSPTVLGYPRADWSPELLPLSEGTPVMPDNAYALSKVVVEETVRMFARSHPDRLFGAFRPCYVIAPEEWAGAPTQQGHTIVDRLRDPRLSAVALFNYLDARDAAAFIDTWLTADVPNGQCYFVGAPDALATRPLADLLPVTRGYDKAICAPLTGTLPAFDSARAADELGWRAQRTWRTELDPQTTADIDAAGSSADRRFGDHTEQDVSRLPGAAGQKERTTA